MVDPASHSLSALVRANAQPLYVLDTSHGLPSNQIHRIARDRHNRLWFAGPAGVTCFDGSFVRAFDRRTGLHCNGLRCVAVSEDSTVWIGTDQGLQALSDSGQPFSDSSPFFRPYGLCEDIVCVGQHLWIGAAQGLLRFEVRGRDLPARLTYSAAIGFVESVAAINEKTAYAASNRLGLVKSDGASSVTINSPLLNGRIVSKLKIGVTGAVWIGTDAGLLQLDVTSDEVTPHHFRTAQDGTVTAIADGARELWVAFGNQLIAYPHESNTTKKPQIFEVDSRINDLLVDELDNIWIATDSSGLAMISCLREAIERIDIGKDGAVFSVKGRPNSMYVIGGEKLLQMVDLSDDTAASTTVLGSMPATTAWDSYHDGRGRWVAAQIGLFYAPDGGVYEQMFADHPVLGAPMRVVTPHRDAIWIGSLRGLVRLVDNVATEVSGHDGISLGYIYTLITDSASRIWAGTLGRGLWVGMDTLSQLAHGLLSASGNTYAVAPGPNGQTLVLQDEKVLLLDDALNVHLVEEHFPVAGWTAIWLDDHTIAIGSSTGLRIVDVATGLTTLSVFSLLSLRQWEFTNNRTLVRDAQGRLLCGVNAGLIRVDLNKLSPFLIAPRPQLLDVTCQGATPEIVDVTTYQLRPGRWSLHVRAFAAWFVDHLKVRYQFKLIGFDDEWSEAKSVPSVTYTSLPTGRYELQCRSHSPLTGVGDAVTLCRVEVIAPWWATGWVGLASRLDSGYRHIVQSQSRNAALLQRNAALEQEILDRTAKLRTANESLQRARDTLEQASTTDALTLTANRRGLERHFSLELKRAKRFDAMIGLIILDIDHFKMVNDRLGHPAGDEYLCTVANILLAEIREGVDLVARYGGEEFLIVMRDATVGGAMTLAERLRSTIAARELPNPAAPMGQLTVSVGVDVLSPHTDRSLSELLQGADLALYEAKRGGRNRVEVAKAKL